VKVEGRRFEVRVTRTDTPNEYRMLIIRATMVINADPELEMARAHEVADRYMKQTCKGGPYEEILAGLEGDVNYRTTFFDAASRRSSARSESATVTAPAGVPSTPRVFPMGRPAI